LYFLKMLDINLLRENPELVRESQRKRFADVGLVDRVLELDAEWKKADFNAAQLRGEHRKLSKEYHMAMRSGKDVDESLAARISAIKAEAEANVSRAEELLKERDSTLVRIGNLIAPGVPVSADEAENEIVRTFGEPRPQTMPVSDEDGAAQMPLRNHVELFELLGASDTVRGANVAGNRGYYLRDVGVLLNQALINFGMAKLRGKGFCLMQTPFFMNKDIMAKCAQLEQFDEELYKVSGEGDDKYLIATSEQTIASYHMGEWMDPESLPIKYAGYSTCFRKEVGRHGADTLGIFRIHQFEKIEQFGITSPETSWEMFEHFIANAEEFYADLGIPYRVVNIVSGELNNAAAQKYDLEAWFPAAATFRELVSTSNCLDYQSRRLGVRYGLHAKGKSDKGTKKSAEFVHMLNATLTATERTMCCIVENYQTPTGVVVPEVLRPFVGLDFLPFVKK
jgi:seryl-tRNA synthetase